MGAMEKPLILRKNTTATCDREMAIQEITRGYELTKQLQSMVLLGCDQPPLEQLEHPFVLFDEVLQALTMALTNLKASACAHPKTSETGSVCLSDQGSDEITSDEINTFSSRSRKRRRVNSWTKVTYSPHDDGHQWRKYGQKNIQKPKISRSYYRCTYREEGCQATKHVEEKGCNDPHLFLVTYYEKHTCKTNNSSIISPQIIMPELDQLLPKEPNLFSFHESINANMFFSQERPILHSSSLNSSSATQQISINGQERVDPDQNIDSINDQTLIIESVAKSSEDCLGSMLDTCSTEGTDQAIPTTSACLSPPWEVMSMDFLIESSFGSDDNFVFSCF